MKETELDSTQVAIAALSFWKLFCGTLFVFSEEADIPLEDNASLVFGIMLGSPGIEVDE